MPERLAGAAVTHRLAGKLAEGPRVGGPDGWLVAQRLGDRAVLDPLVLRDRPGLAHGVALQAQGSEHLAHHLHRLARTEATPELAFQGAKAANVALDTGLVGPFPSHQRVVICE